MQDVLKRNNVTVVGDGKETILFAHGFGCDQNAWKYIKNAFAGQYKLVLFDYIGAGKSDAAAFDANRYATLEGFATDIIDICAALKLTNIILIAHSVSCIIGTIAAIRQPGLFKKMVFIGPSPCYINKENYTGGFEQDAMDELFEVMEEDYVSWARALAPAVMSQENNGEALTKELADSFCSIDPAIAKNFARVTFSSDNRKDLPLIPVPTLTIQCSEDIIAPMVVGQYIHQHAPGNTITIINGYGHCLHMSQPQLTITAIKEWLQA